MRFICLVYLDDAKWDTMSESEQKAIMEEWFAYDDELHWGGHFHGCEALQLNRKAVTLRIQNDQVDITDGPFVETKEHLAGIMILEARDLNHAIALMSKHPGVRAGAFEIRPADEKIYAMREARKQETLQSGE